MLFSEKGERNSRQTKLQVLAVATLAGTGVLICPKWSSCGLQHQGRPLSDRCTWVAVVLVSESLVCTHTRTQTHTPNGSAGGASLSKMIAPKSPPHIESLCSLVATPLFQLPQSWLPWIPLACWEGLILPPPTPIPSWLGKISGVALRFICPKWPPRRHGPRTALFPEKQPQPSPQPPQC